MIHVLQLGMSQNYGGIESFIMNHYRAINREKIQFDFVWNQQNIQMPYSNEIIKLGGHIYNIPNIGIRHGPNLLKETWIDLLQRANANIIHYHTTALVNLYAIRFAKKCGLRVFVHAHPSDYGSNASLIMKARMAYNRKAVHRFSDHLLSCSDTAGKWMFKDRYKVIANSIECNKFAFDKSAREKIRRHYNFSDSLVMINVGKLSDVKNQIFLLDVLKKLKNHNLNAKLILVGKDKLNGMIQKRCEVYGLLDDVVFTGMVEKTEEYYSAADICLFPSKSEGFGIVPIEAQANGLSTIVSDKLIPDINVTKTLRYLPIIDSYDCCAAEIWANEIIKNSSRIDRNDARKVWKFYDVNSTVKVMEDLYLENG